MSGSGSLWRSPVNEILYGTPLDAPVSEQLLATLVDQLVADDYFNRPALHYYTACLEGLESGEPLALHRSQAEQHVRDLLTRLLPALAARGPWPVKSLLVLSPDQVPDPAGDPLIATIPLSHLAIQEAIGRVFHRAGPGDWVLPVVLGRQLPACLVSHRIGGPTTEVRTAADPPGVVAALRRTTGLDVDPV